MFMTTICDSFIEKFNHGIVLMDRKNAKLTNVGQLLESHGKRFLGSNYKDPISSFSDFQEFSVSNPEVNFLLFKTYCCSLVTLFIEV